MTNNYKLSYEELLDWADEISLHQRSLNSLMVEAYKYLNGLSPDIMNDVLTVSETGAVLDIMTFLWTLVPKLTDKVEIRYHVGPVRHGTYTVPWDKGFSKLGFFWVKN